MGELQKTIPMRDLAAAAGQEGVMFPADGQFIRSSKTRRMNCMADEFNTKENEVGAYNSDLSTR